MPDKIQFFPIDVTYKVIDEKPVIHLFGRTSDDKQICVLYDSFEPYFYVIPKKGYDLANELKNLKITRNDQTYQITRAEPVKKKYLGQDVNAVKVFTKLPRDVPAMREELKNWDSIESINENDILFVKRFLIDSNIVPLTLYEAEGNFVAQRLKVPAFKAEKIEPFGTETLLNPMILSIDIETYTPPYKEIAPEKNPIIMISFYAKDFQRVFVWKHFKTELDYVEFVESEAELIEKFKEALEAYKPDILTGYFSDGFDLPYIEARAGKYKTKLDIGLDFSELRINKGKVVTAQITGITHLDIFRFIRKIISGTLETETYNLNAVAYELLGETKHDVDLNELSKAWDNETEINKFCEYSLNDAKLSYNLADKLMPTISEMVKITGLTIYDVNRMGFSQLVEWYLLKQAPNFNEIAPNKPTNDEILKRRLQTYKGGFVFEPEPGLYSNIVVFDYRSLYPTIISSHNISPGTMNCSCCAENAKLVPLEDNKKIWFCKKKKGFIPALIEDLITRRTRVKGIIKDQADEKFAILDARQNSLKLLANAFYGYLGFFAARWYSLECAQATTAFGRYYIKEVIEKAQKSGFKVIYSDSLPYDRHLYVKFKNGDIKLIKIGELYDKYRDEYGIFTLAFDKNKKAIFRPIVKVIRHNYTGKLLKINTKYGSTIVTPQHSVYSFDYTSNKACLVDGKKLKKGDKLISLTNPELIVTYKKGCIFDIAEFNMGNYSNELFLYSDNLLFPNKKGECPYCKKNYNLSSHVSLRHTERRQILNKNSLFSWVGGKNAKIRKMPRHWILDEDLAWILGFYCAEGSVSDVRTKSGRKCLLSFGGQDKELIEKVKLILDAKTNSSTAIIENYDKRISKKMFYYRVQCMPIIALFRYGFDAGKGSEYKKVPWFIFTSEESMRNAFIKGYLDGDGQSTIDKRYATHFIRFSTKSKELAIGLDFLLKSSKYNNNSWGKEIKHVSWHYRRDKPKISNLRFQSAKESKGNFCLAEIRSIEEMPNEKYVYDVEVEGTHNFVDAEGMILVHNTDSVFMTLDGKTKEDADKFSEKVNQELPGLMELEFEGFYPSGIFVSAKVGPYGAKKKYALVSEDGALKIKGFESVRRNWSMIAKDTQEKVLEIILKERDNEKALKYVKKVVDDLRNRRIPLEKVVIHTQLKKEISEYDSKGPHVAVAQRLRNQGIQVGPGSIIRFVVLRGSDIIRNRSKLPEEVKENNYDPDYYINNQVIPAVERIFNVLGYKKEDLLEIKEQTKLGDF